MVIYAVLKSTNVLNENTVVPLVDDQYQLNSTASDIYSGMSE